MSTCEKIAFKPALEGVFGQHFEDSTVGGQLASVGIFWQVVCEPQFLADLVDCIELVRVFSSGPKTRKFLGFWRMTSRRNRPSGRVFSAVVCPGCFTLDGVATEVRKAQGFAQQAAIGVRIGAHAARSRLGPALLAPG